jgi:hypothetical protein
MGVNHLGCPDLPIACSVLHAQPQPAILAFPDLLPESLRKLHQSIVSLKGPDFTPNPILKLPSLEMEIRVNCPGGFEFYHAVLENVGTFNLQHDAQLGAEVVGGIPAARIDPQFDRLEEEPTVGVTSAEPALESGFGLVWAFGFFGNRLRFRDDAGPFAILHVLGA